MATYLLPFYVTNQCSLYLPTCLTQPSPLVLVLIPFLLHTPATFPGSLAVDRAFSSQGKELMFLDVNCIGHESSLLRHVSTKVIAVSNCEESKRLCYTCIVQFLITPRPALLHTTSAGPGSTLVTIHPTWKFREGAWSHLHSEAHSFYILAP